MSEGVVGREICRLIHGYRRNWAGLLCAKPHKQKLMERFRRGSRSRLPRCGASLIGGLRSSAFALTQSETSSSKVQFRPYRTKSAPNIFTPKVANSSGGLFVKPPLVGLSPPRPLWGFLIPFRRSERRNDTVLIERDAVSGLGPLKTPAISEGPTSTVSNPKSACRVVTITLLAASSPPIGKAHLALFGSATGSRRSFSRMALNALMIVAAWKWFAISCDVFVSRRSSASILPSLSG